MTLIDKLRQKEKIFVYVVYISEAIMYKLNG